MKIQGINFENYRNLHRNKLEPAETINVICGENAQGKTNLIEAIWLFTGGRSFRAAREVDLVRFGETRAKLQMQLLTQERSQGLQMSLERGLRKVEINNVKRSATDLIGRFCAVVFSPAHLALIKDGPSQRRRFLDAAICQMWPVYTENLIKFNKIVNQRNALLKSCKKSPHLSETIGVWDESLARSAAQVTKRRLEYVELLQGHAGEAYRGISQGAEELTLQYRSILPKDTAKAVSVAEIEDIYKRAFEATRDEDIVLGFTTKGPHRDDLEIKINGKAARFFSSQGQQRSAVLALKLAESKIISAQRGENPVILLDDVMSELDAKRQDYILNALGNLQVFITCCNPEILGLMGEGKTFLLRNGEIV